MKASFRLIAIHFFFHYLSSDNIIFIFLVDCYVIVHDNKRLETSVINVSVYYKHLTILLFNRYIIHIRC